MNLVIRRITIAVLAAALTGAVLAVPALSKGGPDAVASKKAKKKKCKKGKKGKKSKKRKGCKGGSSSGAGLPGQATPASPTQPETPPPPPGDPVLHVSGVTVTDGSVLGGNSTSGKVTLDGVAPAGGQEVDLVSDLPARVQLPASVVVVSGQKTASFNVDTRAGPPVTATLSASIGTSNAAAELNVVDKPSVSSVKLQRQCFTPGTWSSNRVTLDIPAPDDTDVALATSDPLSLFLPATSVTVPSGSTSALFTVNALVASPDVTVSATAPSTPAQSDSASVSSTEPAGQAAELTLDSASVTAGEGTNGTITLACEAPAGGTEVTLLSQDPSQVGVPETVTVPAGDLSVGFHVTTQPTDTDTPDQDYDISATAGGVTVHATLHVTSVLPT